MSINGQKRRRQQWPRNRLEDLDAQFLGPGKGL